MLLYRSGDSVRQPVAHLHFPIARSQQWLEKASHTVALWSRFQFLCPPYCARHIPRRFQPYVSYSA